MQHQRETAQVAIAVVVPLIRPDGVRNQFPVERQRQRLGADADDFGRVPVRHDAIHSTGSIRKGCGRIPRATLSWIHCNLAVWTAADSGARVSNSGRACSSHSTSLRLFEGDGKLTIHRQAAE
jgi:hypothetical protein